MSLIGPRPERPEFVELFRQDVIRYGDRHRVKSGITGWAQVHGLRGQTSLAERVEWDNYYIANWSLALDLKILALTLGRCCAARSEPAGCILIVYMTRTTTIRVSADTRDRLNALSAREGSSAGEIVARLVHVADDELLLADAEAAFESLAGRPDALALYRSETRRIEAGFEAPAPEW